METDKKAEVTAGGEGEGEGEGGEAVKGERLRLAVKAFRDAYLAVKLSQVRCADCRTHVLVVCRDVYNCGVRRTSPLENGTPFIYLVSFTSTHQDYQNMDPRSIIEYSPARLILKPKGIFRTLWASFAEGFVLRFFAVGFRSCSDFFQ